MGKSTMNTDDPCLQCPEDAMEELLGVCDLQDIPELDPPDDFGVVVRQKFFIEDDCCNQIPYCRGAVVPIDKFLEAILPDVPPAAWCVKDNLFDILYVQNQILSLTNLDTPGDAVNQTDVIDIEALMVLAGTTIPTCATHAIIEVACAAFTYNPTVGDTKIIAGSVIFQTGLNNVSSSIVGNTASNPLDLSRDVNTSFWYADLVNGSVTLNTVANNLGGTEEGWSITYNLSGFLAAG